MTKTMSLIYRCKMKGYIKHLSLYVYILVTDHFNVLL